ncbi:MULTISPECIES: hypothetical protein [Streptococcus]|jgi:hypothetical protein|uniref:Uncharacterized protein n=1 Tax=Streptococcus peroris ATCC 700780 TaxID=888746 RepID=E8KBA2_9STRE|nr:MULTISPECIES: hypothetical protein [Streptococcus]EFX40673.1 hypothetical protein HMPREF9180_0652 [Streptococcus peroris ATCC 700780]MDU7074096.1 hypothetical protein [Streptococcus peroris]OHS85836.1 hypothetical protein HMPREF3237_07930 [Streptococcus sp. HMSC34B10]
MVDILYPIFVIYYTSKLKKTGLRVSKFTTFTAYSFLMISLVRIAFGSLALIVFSIPIFGFLYFRAIGVILFHISIIYGMILLFLSLTLFLDSQKSNQDFQIIQKTPFLSHVLMLAFHALLIYTDLVPILSIQ